MKTQHFPPKAILLTAFVLYNLYGMQAQNSNTMKNQSTDSLAVTQAIEKYYFGGLYEGDVDLLRTVFNPGTLLFGDVKGVPYAKTLYQYLDGVKNRQSPKDSGKPFHGEITSIQIVNSIAVVEANVKMYDFLYHDMLALHKLEGKWVIVNKMLTDVNP